MWVRSAGLFRCGLLSGVVESSHDPPVNVPADYPTIQSAINAVSDGDTINIASGMYRANLVLDKRLTLHGAGAKSTIIQSDVTGAPVITITGSGHNADERLVIKGMKLTRAPQGGNGGSGIHIRAGGDYLTFERVAATGNRSHGIDLDVRGTMTDIKILNCDLSENGGAGINQNSHVAIDRLLIAGTHCNRNMNGAYLNASLRGLSIEDSRFENNRLLGLCVRAENDANFLEALPAFVNNSSFSGNGWHGIYWWTWRSPGILFSCVEAHHNETHGIYIVKTSLIGGQEGRNSELDGLHLCQVAASENGSDGIHIVTPVGDLHNLILDNVEVMNNAGAGIVMEAWSTYGSGFVHGGTIDGRIRDSVSSGNKGGIMLMGPLDRVHLQRNLFENNTVGIRVVSDDAAAGSQANGNNIAGNMRGIENAAPSAPFDASYNWWGNVNGPSGAGFGTGDSVSSGVVYDPWLNAPCAGLVIASILPRRIAVNTRFRISADVLGSRVVSVQYHVNDRSGEMTTIDGVMFAAEFIDGITAVGSYDLCIRVGDCYGNIAQESTALIVYEAE